MKFAKTLLKWLTAGLATALLGACAVVPAGGAYGGAYGGGYSHGQVQGHVYVSPAPVYVGPPAVVVRPAPILLGGWGFRGRGHQGGHHGGGHGGRH